MAPRRTIPDNDGRARNPPAPRPKPGLGFDDLTPQRACVLAVLALARIWEDRFPGGWVEHADLPKYGVHLGGEAETLGKAVRRAASDFLRLPERVVVQSDRSPKGAREDAHRIAPSLPVSVERWLLGSGAALIVADRWREFAASEYRPIVSVEETTASLEETVIHTLLDRGAYDRAIERARVAAARGGSRRERRPILLALATALLRRGRRPEDWEEAERVLEGLSADGTVPVDHHDRIVEARVRVTLAYCLFLCRVRKADAGEERTWTFLDRSQSLLREAEAVGADLSLSDRGQVVNVEGLLLKWEAQVATDPEHRAELFEQAERLLRQALRIWRAARDQRSLEAALYNLGELAFSRYRLDQGHGEEPQIREALSWYEASVAFTENLGSLTQWVLDYIKAAECAALLVPHLAADGREAECVALIRRARRYLRAARQVAAPESWPGKHVRRVGDFLEAAVLRSTPPLPELPAEGT